MHMGRQRWVPAGLILVYLAILVRVLFALRTSDLETPGTRHPSVYLVLPLVFACLLVSQLLHRALGWREALPPVRIMRDAVSPLLGAVVAASCVLALVTPGARAEALTDGLWGEAMLVAWWLREVVVAGLLGLARRQGPKAISSADRARAYRWIHRWASHSSVWDPEVWAEAICAMEAVGQDKRALRLFAEGLHLHLKHPAVLRAVRAAARSADRAEASTGGATKLLDGVVREHPGTWASHVASEILVSSAHAASTVQPPSGTRQPTQCDIHT